MSETKLRILAIIIGVLVPCIAGEFFLRAFKPQPTYSYLLYMTGEFYKQGDVIPFTLKENFHGKAPSQEFQGQAVTYTTNGAGLRGRKDIGPKKGDEYRILVLGDSYTFGVYVEDDETYPAQLEQQLAIKHPSTTVINAGYADGWSPDEHYAWLVRHGLALKPDLIIYGFFIGNDISDICEPCWSVKDEIGLPLQILNNSIWIDQFGRIRSRLRDAKTVGTDWIYRYPILRESHLLIMLSHTLASVAEQVKRPFGVEEQLQMKSAVGHEYGQDYFSMIFAPPTENRASKSREELFFKLIQGLKKRSSENGADFLMLMIPVNFQFKQSFIPQIFGRELEIKRDFFAEIKPLLRDMEVDYIDILEEMQKAPHDYFPNNGEVHFNRRGARFVAQVVARHINNHGHSLSR